MRWSTDPEVLFGFPKGSFGQELRIMRTVHPDDRSRIEDAVVEAVKSGVYEAEYRAVRPDGSVVWITGRGRVYVHVDRVDHSLQISVEDTGQGISPAFLPHVFERFRQQDASSTRAAPGLGLGLSIAKQLIELHGGTIAATSAGDGKGATFTVRVPAPPRKALSMLRAASPVLA